MNSAVIKESSGKSVEEFNRPGLFRLLLKHEVKSTTADYLWDGPQISPVEWARMMAFFEWTYESEKSESQVRWYVHPTQGWRCWAFPQKGGTGMTTKEIADHPKALEQRRLFSSAEGWEYCMTVHHHCSSGAFQSGTDEHDEKNVDGIHITIGHLDKPVRDFHVRMYLRGHKFEPRMNFFWGVGPEVFEQAQKCFTLFGYLPTQELDKVARAQMALSSEALWPGWTLEQDGPKFPVEWRENYIVDRSVVVARAYWQPGGEDGLSWCYHCQARVKHSPEQCYKNPANKVHSNGGGRGKTKGGGKNGGKSDSFSLATTLKDIVGQLTAVGNAEDEIETFLTNALGDPEAKNYSMVYRELADAGIEIEEMEQFLSHLIDQREQKLVQQEAQQEAQQQQGLTTQQNHPDAWEGYIGG